MKLADLRREYTLHGLLESEVDPNPLKQFQVWFDAVLAANLLEPTAMTLATVDVHGQPSARIVLLKEIDDRGFLFFTNYHSRKGNDLAANPKAAIVLHWPEFERQVRVEGTVERVERSKSEEYFRSRPYKSQLSAVLSEQSQIVASRDVLEHRMSELEASYSEGQVPTPEHWGGYRLVPSAIEFWQGRRSRLHDRLLYSRNVDGSWKLERLSP
jgi:pyridoxamine 5'-phosphate oxidase